MYLITPKKFFHKGCAESLHEKISFFVQTCRKYNTKWRNCKFDFRWTIDNYSETTALKELKSNENIIITKADKGGQIVVLDKNHYIESVNVLLNDGPYITPIPTGTKENQIYH